MARPAHRGWRGRRAPRERWVKTRLVERGEYTGTRMGFADIYSFQKRWRSTRRRAAREAAVDRRPSIIEALWKNVSRLARRLNAEPLILAFAADPAHFSGLPDSLLNHPGRLRVNTVLAVAAKPARLKPRAYHALQEAATTPLQRMTTRHGFFTEHSAARSVRQAIARHLDVIRAQSWRRKARLLEVRQRRRWAVERLHWPSVADLSDDLQQEPQRSTRLNLIQLYGVYTESIASSTLGTSCLCGSECAPSARSFHSRFAYDWEHYFQDVHFPTVVRIRARRRRTQGSPARRKHRANRTESVRWPWSGAPAAETCWRCSTSTGRW